MLSVSVISGDAAYYSGSENVETLENAEGQWLGKGTEALGLSGAVAPDQLDALLQGHLPDGTRLTRQKDGKETNRPGLDLTFGAPKSLSILALLGGDTRLTDAHNAAARQAMLEVERSVNTRLTRDGVTRTVTTGNMVAALFTHDTNRAGEMHLHDHGLLLNLTQAEGKWRALGSDTRHRSGIREMVYDMKLAYGQLYREFLRPGVEAAGYTTVDSGPHGMFELAEVPRAVVEAYSQRTAQIDAAVGREASALSRAVAALDTRQSKTFVDGDARRAQWMATLDGLDFDPAAVIAAAKARSQPGRDAGPDISGPGMSGEALSQPGRPVGGLAPDALQPDSPEAGARLKAAVAQAVSSLSDKKAQFAYSEVLAAVVSRLPAEAGMVQRARDGIEAARVQGRLVALDKDRGLFTSDIHLLDELTLRQFAREHSERGRAMVSGAALLSGHLPDVTGVYAELARARDPVSVLAGRGGMAVQRGRMEQLTTLARAQGRQVMVLAADSRSARFLEESETLVGSLVGRSALREDLPLSAWSTVIVTEAESLTLKESVLLMTQARASGAQVLLMDSGKRQGTGSALSVLKDEGVVVRAFNDAERPSVQLISEPDKKVRYQALALEYARETVSGQTVVAQVAGTREQRLLTTDIRHALRAEGVLTGEDVRVATLTPVWLDSKNRHSRETYRAGMVMERWQAETRETQSWRIDRVGADTHVLRLVNEAGELRTEKISQLDSQWRLYEPGDLPVAAGDMLKVTGHEARGKLKAQETVQVADIQDGMLTLKHVGKASEGKTGEDRTVTLDISQPLRLAHGYVEPVGQSVRAEGRVLAALSGREMRDEVINQLARSGNDIRLFTALDAGRAEAKLARHPLIRVVSAQVEAATGTQGQGVEAALGAAAALPRTPAAQSVFLALSQVQQERMAFQAPRLLSAAISINPTVPVMAIRDEIDRQVREGMLIAPENSPLLVPRETFETEKAIIRHIAEGKGAVAPLMAAVPDTLLQGLTTGQRSATRLVLESPDRFTAVQGYAGVGKTTQFRTMLAALDTLPADQRPEVVGLAPTHRAVEEMQGAGVRAQTLDSFLFEDRQARQNGEKPDYGRTLFLVDEASMVGIRAMSEAYQAVAAGGGRAITSGDDAQLRAIEPGQPFRLMQQRSAIDVAVMKEIVRQVPELRGVVYAMIDGQYAQALHQVAQVTPDVVPRDAGAYVPVSSVEEIRSEKTTREAREQAGLPGSITEAIAADFAGRTAPAREDTLVVAHLNADRRDINGLIHDQLLAKGVTQNPQAITVLDPVRVRHNALRSLSGWVAQAGNTALINREYWTVGATDREAGVVRLTHADGREKLISPFENSTEEVQLYRPRDIHVSEGDRIRFTRSDAERGYTGNSFWSVARLEADSMTLRSPDGQQTRRLNLSDPADRHTDLGYAVTAYGAQGASARYVITLEGTEGGRKQMATKESGYVTLSRTKEHVQVWTDNREGWLAELAKHKGDGTAHDYLNESEDQAARAAEGILSWAKPLERVAAGRALLKNHGLAQGASQGVFVPATRRQPEPGVGFALWDTNGNPAGLVIFSLTRDERGGLSFSGAHRVTGREDARFAGIQQSRNGEVRVADSLSAGLELAREYPAGGVIVRLAGDDLPHNLSRVTGADNLIDEAVVSAQAARMTPPETVVIPVLQDPAEVAKREAEKLAALLKESPSQAEPPEPATVDRVLNALKDETGGPDTEAAALATMLTREQDTAQQRLDWDIAEVVRPSQDKQAERQPEADTSSAIRLRQVERDIVKEKSLED